MKGGKEGRLARNKTRASRKEGRGGDEGKERVIERNPEGERRTRQYSNHGLLHIPVSRSPTSPLSPSERPILFFSSSSQLSRTEAI